VDQARVLPALDLKPGQVFLDLGAGPGGYALLAAERIGPQGLVLAVDLWEEGLERLAEEARARGLANLRTMVADIGTRLDLDPGSVDTCLLATVLHHLTESGQAESALKEVFRLLKPGGRLAVIEFNKVADGPGPPLEVRLSPQEVADLAGPQGFVQELLVEAGPHNYLIGLRPRPGSLL